MVFKTVTWLGLGVFTAYAIKDATYEVYRRRIVNPYNTERARSDPLSASPILFTGLFDAIKDFRSAKKDVTDQIKDKVDQVADEIKRGISKAKDAADDVSSKVSSTKDEIKQAAREIKHDIKTSDATPGVQKRDGATPAGLGSQNNIRVAQDKTDGAQK